MQPNLHCKSEAKEDSTGSTEYRVGHPLNRLGLDIFRLLPTTTQGNTCILVVADYFTQWIAANALLNQTAEVTAQALVQKFLLRFGCPLEIHTDQGHNFQI